MIVDTSALIAIIADEQDAEQIRAAVFNTSIIVIPAPVVTETWLVTHGRHKQYREISEELLATINRGGARVVPFERRHADITATARALYGKGNGAGGKLNFGDLMVYAIAKDSGLPLLCTGSDFATTDLVLHPASRLDP